MPIFAGCDIGSTTGKVVLMDENQKILGSSIVRSARGPQATADHAMTLALEAAKLERDVKIDYLVSTGYGRTNIKGMNEDISEISCHARGVHLTGNILCNTKIRSLAHFFSPFLLIGLIIPRSPSLVNRGGYGRKFMEKLLRGGGKCDTL